MRGCAWLIRDFNPDLAWLYPSFLLCYPDTPMPELIRKLISALISSSYPYSYPFFDLRSYKCSYSHFNQSSDYLWSPFRIRSSWFLTLVLICYPHSMKSPDLRNKNLLVPSNDWKTYQHNFPKCRIHRMDGWLKKDVVDNNIHRTSVYQAASQKRIYSSIEFILSNRAIYTVWNNYMLG